MNATRILAALTTLAVLAVAVPASADDEPTAEQPTCKIVSVKRTFKTAWVNKHGLPVKVTCDRPAKLIAAFGFRMGKAKPGNPDYDWMIMHPGGIPGISNGPEYDVPAGESTIAAQMSPKKFVMRYDRVALWVHVALQDPEHPKWFRDIQKPRKVDLVR